MAKDNMGDDTNDNEEENYEDDDYIPLNMTFFSMREVDWMRNTVGLVSMDSKTPYVEYALSQQYKVYLEVEIAHQLELRDYYILDKESMGEQDYNEWMKKERCKPSDIVIGERPRSRRIIKVS